MKNTWSCLLNSFALAINIDPEIIIHDLGHNGSEIIFPELGDLGRKGFNDQELTRVLFRLGYSVTNFKIEYEVFYSDVLSHKVFFLDIDLWRNYKCVISGITLNGTQHAAYWNGETYNDGCVDRFDSPFKNVDQMWIIGKFNKI